MRRKSLRQRDGSKHEGNPVLGGKLGTCFDISVLKENGKFRMWFSWRPKASVVLAESSDGMKWSDPVLVLEPNLETRREADINRPCVVKRGADYFLGYTGQAHKRSSIGFATSSDGIKWLRKSDDPVLRPEVAWEGVALMCPHVLWDDAGGMWKMWYSGGERGEPNAIGYATSRDGLKWEKQPTNPIFRPEKSNDWEKDRVTACQVIAQPDGFLMFYIGFSDVSFAQIGIARSKDGVTSWERHLANPI